MSNPTIDAQEMIDLVQQLNRQVFEALANNDQRDSRAERLATRAAEDLQVADFLAKADALLAEINGRLDAMERTLGEISRHLDAHDAARETDVMVSACAALLRPGNGLIEENR